MIIDYDEIARFQKRLLEASERLDSMTNGVALARQVVEYDSDRRKKALAMEVAPLIGEMSAVAAEVVGRASPRYARAMGELAKQYESAQRVMAEWEAAKIAFEAARSVLSVGKESMRLT